MPHHKSAIHAYSPKTAVCSHHRPNRNETQHTRPLLVGRVRVNFEPKALAAGTAGRANGYWPPALPAKFVSSKFKNISRQ